FMFRMRLCNLILLIYILLLVPQLLLSTSHDYYSELFGTSDFALISQQNCARFIETDVGSRLGQCPVGLSETHNLDELDHDCPNVRAGSVRSHLVRDVHQKYTPRLLFILVNNTTKQINYGIEKLSLAGNNSQWRTPATLKETSYTGYQMQNGETLADSIFDTQSGLLYLIIKSKENPSLNYPVRRLRLVYISNIFRGRTEFWDFGREFALHMNTWKSFDWVENPYEHTVYYAKQNASHTAIHRLPISEVLASLIDGTEGVWLSDVPDSRRFLIWAQNGAMISMARNKDDRGPIASYYLRNTTLEKGKICAITDKHLDAEQWPKTRRLITVFDWDYCMLAYGGDGRKGADGRQCPVYYDVLAVIDKSGSNNTIFIVLIVLLTMISVVLAVYVCLLKRNLEDSLPNDDRKPVPYYPSGQPLDSTFDMSVDRWDQY
ncbi:hypothetical protein PENTCL1PPCAC_7039, partial [Pristionchus entomophagus]